MGLGFEDFWLWWIWGGILIVEGFVGLGFEGFWLLGFLVGCGFCWDFSLGFFLGDFCLWFMGG